MMIFKERVFYYLWATYRRRSLDALQLKYKNVYQGVVLDIGGRDRGAFKKPKDAVVRWINADINPAHAPDIVLDVSRMKCVETESIDVVNAIELFEHVDHIIDGIKECHRVLNPEGVCIISCPFLWPVHGDPYDYQRWTETRWRTALADAGFIVEECIVMGRFFSVWADMAKALVRSMPGILRKIGYLGYPLLDLLVLLDKTRFVVGSAALSGFHEGYFIVCRKSAHGG